MAEVLNEQYNVQYEYNEDTSIYTIYANDSYSLLLNEDCSYLMNECGNLTTNLQSLNFNFSYVKDMAFMCSNAYSLTGSPICEDNVINMRNTYANCGNLTGSPVCGNNVTNMVQTYSNCRNLTGSPACGSSVTNMYYCYNYCLNLTGEPVVGESVTCMTGAYRVCQNITGAPICGNNVTEMLGAYYYAINIGGGTAYWNKVEACNDSLTGIRKDIRTNIIIGNAETYARIQNNYYKITGSKTSWSVINTTYGVNTGMYNSKYNIYIYNNCEPFDK